MHALLVTAAYSDGDGILTVLPMMAEGVAASASGSAATITATGKARQTRESGAAVAFGLGEEAVTKNHMCKMVMDHCANWRIAVE